MNCSRPSARYRYHSCRIEPLEVMALASRLACPENAAPSPPPPPPPPELSPGSWLSKTKKIPQPVLSSNIERLGGVKLHFRCCRYTLWTWIVSKQCLDQVLGSLSAFSWLCHLCDLLTITVRNKPAAYICDNDVLFFLFKSISSCCYFSVFSSAWVELP